MRGDWCRREVVLEKSFVAASGFTGSQFRKARGRSCSAYNRWFGSILLGRQIHGSGGGMFEFGEVDAGIAYSAGAIGLMSGALARAVSRRCAGCRSVRKHLRARERDG